MKKILFICSANISRSYLAEQLLKHELKEMRKDFYIFSAGVMALPGTLADPKIVEYLMGTGIPVGNHTSRQVLKEDVDRADRVYVMGRSHADYIEKLSPESMDKVVLLGELVSPGQYADDIVDPFGRSSYHYRVTISQISLAIKNLAQDLLTHS